jgi:hypothetical protein
MSRLIQHPQIPPPTPANSVPPGTYADALVPILAAIEDHLIGGLMCSACGCWCNPSETCPGCVARRLAAR